MKILVVLHEATRTGAPRIGGLVASALKKYFFVKMIALRDGAMTGWLESQVGHGHFEIVDRGPTPSKSFNARVAAAKQYLERSDCDLVYVNSLASSEYLVAANAVGKKAVLHLHEKVMEMQSLLRQQVTKLNIGAFTPALILAGSGLADDFASVFGALPKTILDWGIAFDADEVIRLSNEEALGIANVLGRRWVPGNRLCVGMVGHASPRKGADIFLGLAERNPDIDFLWIGEWDAKKKSFVRQRVENFYFSGGVDNPYKYMRQFDLFFLSSREDPNPVVLAEAMLLGIPIFCFSQATAVTDFLARNAVVYHGPANLDCAHRVISLLDKKTLRAASISPPVETVRQHFDIQSKIKPIIDLLNSLMTK